MNIKNKLIKIITEKNNKVKIQHTFNITGEVVKVAVTRVEDKVSKALMPIDKNHFLLTAEELKKIALNYDSSKFSVSKMNECQKYKNKYSSALMDAKGVCRRLGK